MGYTNSGLVDFKWLSPNHSGQRNHVIDRISPHCVVGQCSAESLGEWFSQPSTQASSNYGIDKDGRIGLYVEEKNRSWCTSSNANDQRAVTIECASDLQEPYWMNEKVYASLIRLCTDICKRNGKKKLLWFADKDKSLAYEPKSDEMLITVHRWFANKSCPGNWLYARLGDVAAKVTAALGGTGAASQETDAGKEEQKKGLQATAFKDLTEEEVISKVGSLFSADQKKSGILASVSLAQFILESGYGKSELAQNANNCFGMKKVLSGNSWSASFWDGKSIYTKKTQEQEADGSMITIVADFRKYGCVEESIADHSAYLNGAMNGDQKRYKGLAGEKDYKKAAQIIKDGGYATSLTYVEKLCDIIQRWNLTRFDVAADILPETEEKWYRVRKDWKDARSQIGAFHVLEYAKACVDKNPGTFVFDEDGRVLYPEVPDEAEDVEVEVPFLVQIEVERLNIRTGPGTDHKKTGRVTGRGIFTIVEVSEGKGSDDGWGRLKAGGWVALDYCDRI